MPETDSHAQGRWHHRGQRDAGSYPGPSGRVGAGARLHATGSGRQRANAIASVAPGEVRALLASRSAEGIVRDWPGDTEVIVARKRLGRLRSVNTCQYSFTGVPFSAGQRILVAVVIEWSASGGGAQGGAERGDDGSADGDRQE